MILFWLKFWILDKNNLIATLSTARQGKLIHIRFQLYYYSSTSNNLVKETLLIVDTRERMVRDDDDLDDLEEDEIKDPLENAIQTKYEVLIV